MSERIDHPAHYGGEGNPYEVINILEATLTPGEFRGFLKGNVVKYVLRAERKGGREDYQKAAWYAERLTRHEGEEEGVPGDEV
jgi:hypothetical protein